MAARRKPKRQPAPTTPKSKGGRSTDYRPELCGQVIELGKQGKSRAQIAATLGHSRQTLYDWEKAHPKFLDAMQRAHDLALAWWEDQGQNGIWAGKQFNAAAYGLQMRNRFRDEYNRPDTVVDLNLDEVRAQIAGKLARLAPASAAEGMAAKPQR